MTDLGLGRGVLFRDMYPTPAVYLSGATRQVNGSCSAAVRHELLGTPNILRHSVTCVHIFMGLLPAYAGRPTFHPTCLFINKRKKRFENSYNTLPQALL